MESKAAFNRWAARRRARADEFGFRLGPDSFQRTAENRARRKHVTARRPWRVTFCLLLLNAGLGCARLTAEPATNFYELGTNLPKPGSIEWEWNHRLYRERQELHRKRVAVPPANGTNVRVAADALTIFSPKTAVAPAPAPASLLEMLFRLFLFVVLFFLGGSLVLRQLAPEVFLRLNQFLNPSAFKQVTRGKFPEKVRAEDEAFGKFLKTFRAGPPTPPPAIATGPGEPFNEFPVRAKKSLITQRKLLQNITREASDQARHRLLKIMHFEMDGLKSEAGLFRALPVWHVSSALEGLLRQLTVKIRNVTPSTLRTVHGGLALLEALCVPGLKADLFNVQDLKFLIVDDDLISRQALFAALEKAFRKPDLAADGETALAQTSRQTYDVIFLDVQMPGMDGFELCTKIRGTAQNHSTPVVFVTNYSDFEARVQSTISGGNDLLGKPFLTFEVTVKALTLAVQGRLGNCGHQPRVETTSRPVMAATQSPLTDKSHTAKPEAVVRPLSSMPIMAEAMVKAFLNRTTNGLGVLKTLCQKILEAEMEETRQSLFADGFLRLNALIPQNVPRAVHPAYQMITALEGLFRKLLQDSKNFTPTTLDTITAAVDLLEKLCVPTVSSDLAINPPLRMLVVDDDLVARRTIVGTLQTTFGKPESVATGEAALTLLAEKTFDVIFLDAIMPGMDGFEICARIRDSAINHATPVIFVTSLDEGEVRAKARRQGGNDLIAKPFLTSELTVKALTFALGGRLRQPHLRPALNRA